MPRIVVNAVVLALAVGCSFDLAHKTSCESQSDCLDGYVCQDTLCTSATDAGGTAGSGATDAGGSDTPTAGNLAMSGGGNTGGKGPVSMGGTGGGVGPSQGGTAAGVAGTGGGGGGGAGGAEGGAGGAAAGADGGANDAGAGGEPGTTGCVEPSKTAELAYLLYPNPPVSYLRYGSAVAIDGDTLVVGALKDESAFVYVKEGCGWSLQAKLVPSDPTLDASFGSAVAIQGDTILVGAPFAMVTPTAGGDAIKAGAVYTFQRKSGVWTQNPKLQAPNADAYDQFGGSVAIDGDFMVVGAIGEDSASRTINIGSDDNSLESDGAAYVFGRSGVYWALGAYLKRTGDGTGTSQYGGFGTSVAISGTHIAVGSPGADASGIANAGATYIFNDDAGAFTLEQTLLVRKELAGADAGTRFGASVALSGDSIAVGAPDDGEGTGQAYGTVTVFARIGVGPGSWAMITRLGNYARSTDFGASVSLKPQRLLIGDPMEINGGQGIDAPLGADIATGAGAAYLFTINPFTARWELTHYIKSSNSRMYDEFGAAVAISGNEFVIGAPIRHSAPEELYSPSDKYRYGPGAAYAFEIAP